MIPKIIHYCWFGPKDIPEELLVYIKTWKEYCPDYKIILWNEEHFNVHSNKFTKEHYNKKNYAFVSDYVRAYALYNFGGVYLDTDIEIKASIDKFLNNDAFAGFESKGTVQTAVWGSRAYHKLPEMVIDYYEKLGYTASQEANTRTISRILLEKFKINIDENSTQTGSYLDSDITIYPSDYFCIETSSNFTTHHFYGSWLKENNISTKKSITLRYHLEKTLSADPESIELIKAIAHTVSLKTIIRVLLRKTYNQIIPKHIDALLKNSRKNK